MGFAHAADRLARTIIPILAITTLCEVGLAATAEPQARPFSASDLRVNARVVRSCDPGILLTQRERRILLEKLRISNAGRQLLAAFQSQYKALHNLVIQWDTISYSQVAGASFRTKQPDAGLGYGICVHLAKRLPAIEHLADLAHELTHATRLELRTLQGHFGTSEEFVRARLTADGGEADSFATECTVKREILGDWDAFCAPYVTRGSIHRALVVQDLYNGRLSASLTGETYPKMLARQFHLIQAARVARNPAREASRRPASRPLTQTTSQAATRKTP